MLGTAGHIVVNTVFIQLMAQGVEKIVNVFQTLGALFIEQFGNAFVFSGVLMAEAQVFQLPFELPHA